MLEVLFEVEGAFHVDTWSLGGLVSSTQSNTLMLRDVSQVWDLFEGQHILHALDENKELSATHYVAEMVGYLGLPPRKYVRRSKVTKKVFDHQSRYSRTAALIDLGLASF